MGREETFLLIDGLWFGRWFVLMVYRQSDNLLILHIAIAGREVTTKISRDLLHVVSLGYRFTGIVKQRNPPLTQFLLDAMFSEQELLALHSESFHSFVQYPISRPCF